jgi:hypothetical protein
VPGRNTPDYWIRPPQVLSSKAGLHRFTWDLRYPPPAVQQFGYPIAAVFANTPREPRGPWVLPGEYTVRLTAGGRSMSQPLRVRMDPRVKTPPAGLQEQFEQSMRVHDAIARSDAALLDVRALRKAIGARRQGASADLASALASLDERVSAFEGGRRSDAGFARLNAQLGTLLDLLQDADVPPTTQGRAAVDETTRGLEALLTKWREFNAAEVAPLGARLTAAGLEALPVR